MPPLWQYLASFGKVDVFISVPKGVALMVPTAFIPANRRFLGHHPGLQRGSIAPIMVPRRPRRGCLESATPPAPWDSLRARVERDEGDWVGSIGGVLL